MGHGEPRQDAGALEPVDVQLTPRLRPPPGAWDTHIHVIDPRFPAIPNPFYPPPVATARDYRAVQERLGLERVLVVQSITYGTDNSCLLDAITALGPGARGVAMVGAGVADAELQRLARNGVRGARFLMLQGGVVGWDEAEGLAERIAALGWFVNLQLAGDTLPDRADLLARLPGPLVVDHMGLFRRPVSPDDPGVLTLLRLLDTGRTWVKLSAPFPDGSPRYAGAVALARILVRHAPERMLWGSDWPHVTATQVRNEAPESNAVLLDLLLDYAEDDAHRRRILVDNPDTLIGAG